MTMTNLGGGGGGLTPYKASGVCAPELAPPNEGARLRAAMEPQRGGRVWSFSNWHTRCCSCGGGKQC